MSSVRRWWPHGWEPIAALAIGWAVFLAIRGAKVLRPGYVDWLMDGDPATHWLGWEFFRHSPLLQWPLGANPAYGMEFGSSVVFTDSIPLFAVLFKLLNPLLPEVFQYSGIWLLLCFGLQGLFAWLLLCRFTDDRKLALIGSAFFVIAPPYLFRLLQGHFALAAHWMLLAGLWLYFSRRLAAPAWLILLPLAAAVHVYLLVLAGLIWLADLVQRRLLRQNGTGALLGHCSVGLVLIVVTMWAMGYFMLGGSELGAQGFGLYRLNLISLIDPDPFFSLILRDQRNGLGDHEGFGFMGLGMLLLAVVVGYERLRGGAVAGRAGLMPLLVTMGLLTVYAISPSVAFGPYNLFSYPVPGWLEPLTSAFRVSGRFVWLVFYLIYLGIFCALFNRLKGSKVMGLCALALCAQALDSASAWGALQSRLAHSPAFESPMKSPAWKELAGRYKRLVLVRSQNVAPRWMALAQFAAAHRMSVNTGYFARYDARAGQLASDRFVEDIERNRLDADTLYVLVSNELWHLALTRHGPQDVAAVLDGFWILAPGLKSCTNCPASAGIGGG